MKKYSKYLLIDIKNGVQSVDNREDWVFQEDRAYFKNKEVIAEEDIETFLREKYNDPVWMQNSVDKFYSRLKSAYYGFQKKDVAAFLDKQKTRQIYSKQTQREVQPILTTAPNDIWIMDTFSMETGKKLKKDLTDTEDVNYPHWNHNFKHVLLIADHFSKYAWAFPLSNLKQGVNKKQKTVEHTEMDDATKRTVAQNLESILQEGHVPKALYSDNAFKTGYIDRLCSDETGYGFTCFHNMPYRPIGAIERLVQTIKNKLYQHMELHENKEWVAALEAVMESYNNTQHSAFLNKLTPSEVYNGDADVLEEAREYTTKYRRWKIFRKSDLPPLEKGDKVRILVQRTAQGAKHIKHKAKAYEGRWSKEVYEVDSVKVGHKEMVLDQYKLVELPQFFKRSELLKVEEEEEPPKVVPFVNPKFPPRKRKIIEAVKPKPEAKEPPKRYKLPEKTLVEGREKRIVRPRVRNDLHLTREIELYL